MLINFAACFCRCPHSILFVFSPSPLELSDQLDRMRKEKEHVQRENEDLRQTNDDMQSMLDDDKDAVVAKLRSQLKSKDRQIESLEEQLQRSTNFEIKKLKRGTALRHVP